MAKSRMGKMRAGNQEEKATNQRAEILRRKQLSRSKKYTGSGDKETQVEREISHILCHVVGKMLRIGICKMNEKIQEMES